MSCAVVKRGVKRRPRIGGLDVGEGGDTDAQCQTLNDKSSIMLGT